jgi:hypothetical protein
MTTLGQMMTGGDRGGREKDDFYATPEECTRALIEAEGALIPMFVWEPACGDGAIARVLEKSGRVVLSSDLVDRGYGDHGCDFLLFVKPLSKAIVTNPPFKLAEAFIRKSFDLGAIYVALFLKATFWHAARRSQLFNDHRPARIYAMNWRPDFSGAGQPTMDCIWCVWDGPAQTTDYRILRRPG